MSLRTALQILTTSLIIWITGPSLAAEHLPRSMLVLEQSDVRGPFYAAIFSGLRSEVNAKATSPVTIYVENLDLNRFTGLEYEEGLRAFLDVKYKGKPIGVIVTVGSAAFEYALRWRAELWPGIPIVVALTDEATIAELNLSSDITGRITQLRLRDMVSVARAVVKGLKRVAIVGDRFETQPMFRYLKNEIPTVAAELEVIDLTGLPMAELRRRVAVLPDDAAILYTSVFSDGAGVYFPPADAVAMIAEVANRPIVISFETFLGRGGIGGYVALPTIIGKEAAALALRILDGESPASIPITLGNALRPVFDWRQMQRWGVDEDDLPPGSEIRNRVLPVWEEYPSEIAAIAVMLLLQSGLIGTLLHERRRRRYAEMEAHERITELAHMNRRATAGELSASIAHELNQPLGAILTNTEAAERLLGSSSPDLQEIKEILADIKRDDQRAGEVIARLRRLLQKAPVEPEIVDANQIVREVFDFLAVQARAAGITLNSALDSKPLRVRGDSIQLQQVVLNLVINGIEAVTSTPNGERRIKGRTDRLDDTSVEISIADSGPGIPSDRLGHVFDPFFTTKDNGMGMGLSIARTIVEAHGGRIWAENRAGGGGAVFRIGLPLAEGQLR